MIKIAVTGGIGSGKSYVCRILEREYGIPIYVADDEAKRLMVTDEGIKTDLKALLGDTAYLPDGALNKPLLSTYLFASAEHVRAINAIVHPRVKTDFERWASIQEAKGMDVVGMESAILFEAGFTDTVDFIVMVYAPVKVRIKRVRERDHATVRQVRSRMEQQLPDKQKMRGADFIIRNDGNQSLSEQLDSLAEILKERKSKR